MNTMTTTPEMQDQNLTELAGTGTRPQASIAELQVAAVQSGVASRYWDEGLAYPAGSTASLWLDVSGWKHLDNPGASVRDMVQRAFLGSSSNVRVWYDNAKIVGLVVEGS